MEKLTDTLSAGLSKMLSKLFVENPTAAAWAVAFFVACYALYKLALYARGLQEKLDTASVNRQEALDKQAILHDEKIQAKDREIASLNGKFHEHVGIATNAFNSVKNVLLRTDTKRYVLNCHNGIQALGANAGLKPHEMGMQAINDPPLTDS